MIMADNGLYENLMGDLQQTLHLILFVVLFSYSLLPCQSKRKEKLIIYFSKTIWYWAEKLLSEENFDEKFPFFGELSA